MGAKEIISFLANPIGMACDCIGFGFLKWFLSKLTLKVGYNYIYFHYLNG